MSDYRFKGEPEWESEPTTSNRGGCWAFFSILLVIILIVSSASGAVWYFFYRDQGPDRDQPAIQVVDGRDADDDEDLENEAAAESTNATAESEEPEGSTETAVLPSTSSALTVNRIVYINGEGQVVTIDPSGQNDRVLTDTDRRFQFPAWSPLGDQIAVIGTNRSGASLHVLQEGEEAVDPNSLFADRQNSPFYLYWSPDNRHVSFLANHPQGMALHLVPADGSEESRLVTTGGPFYWHWDANGEQMLIHSGFAGPGARLELLTLADSDGEADEQIALPGFFQAPGISADGRFWAYAEQNTAENSSLIIWDTETMTEQSLRHAGLVAMTWSPSANQLAFTTGAAPEDNNFVGPLRLMDAATGETTLLSSDDVAAFFWSPNGRFLAAISLAQTTEDDINVQAPDVIKPQLFKSLNQLTLPLLKLVVFDVASGEGRVLLNFTPTINYLSQFLPFFDQYALSHQIWSPDSEAIVLPVLEETIEKIYVVPVNGGQKRFLAEGTMSFWSRQ